MWMHARILDYLTPISHDEINYPDRRQLCANAKTDHVAVTMLRSALTTNTKPRKIITATKKMKNDGR